MPIINLGTVSTAALQSSRVIKSVYLDGPATGEIPAGSSIISHKGISGSYQAGFKTETQQTWNALSHVDGASYSSDTASLDAFTYNVPAGSRAIISYDSAATVAVPAVDLSVGYIEVSHISVNAAGQELSVDVPDAIWTDANGAQTAGMMITSTQADSFSLFVPDTTAGVQLSMPSAGNAVTNFHVLSNTVPLTHIYAANQTNMIWQIGASALPRALQVLSLANCGEASATGTNKSTGTVNITGVFSDLPPNMVSLALTDTASTVSGFLSNFPATMTSVQLDNAGHDGTASSGCEIMGADGWNTNLVDMRFRNAVNTAGVANGILNIVNDSLANGTNLYLDGSHDPVIDSGASNPSYTNLLARGWNVQANT